MANKWFETVAVAQRRMDNISSYVEPDSWTAPER